MTTAAKAIRRNFNASDEVCDLCSNTYCKCFIVDIGCGKGGFVELLRKNGFNAIGYDNAYQGSSPYIRKSFLVLTLMR